MAVKEKRTGGMSDKPMGAFTSGAANAAGYQNRSDPLGWMGGYKIKTPPPTPTAEQHQRSNAAPPVAGLAWPLPLITSIRVIGRGPTGHPAHVPITALWIM